MVVTLRRVTASQSSAGCAAIRPTKRLNEFSCFHFEGKTFLSQELVSRQLARHQNKSSGRWIKEGMEGKSHERHE